MMSENVFQLVYASKSRQQYDQKSLEKMVCGFRENNRDLNITGLLLYDDFGIFVQLIEGAETTIKDLYVRIAEDQNHGYVTLLHEQRARDRLFPDWRMGLQYFGSSLAELKTGCASEVETEAVTPEFIQQNKDLFVELLLCYRHEH